MSYRQTTLDSGIRVITEPMPGVRSVALGFWVGIGSRDESPAEAGASHFLEHLLFKGTARRSAREIAEALDAVGGDMNAFTSKEFTCFYARVLDRDLPLAVDVLADMIVDATNSDPDVEAERQVVLEEINIHLDTPEDLVHSDFSELLFDGHPLGAETLGSVASITDMSRDTIHGWYQQQYRPATLTVAAAGNLDHDELVALVEAHTGDLGRPGGSPPARTAPQLDPVSRPTDARVGVRHRPTEQAHVVIGVPGIDQSDDRRHALRVTNMLLGGSMSSRLFQEIREQRGLAYTTYSYAGTFTDGGLFGAYAGTTPGKVDELCKVLRDQLDRVVTDVTADEVARAKGAVAGGMVLGLEDPGSRMTRLGRIVATDAELVTIDELLARVEEVDLDAVRSVAADLLSAPHLLTVVGPFDEADRDRFAAYVD